MKVLKQVVGIDVSKDSFHACFGKMDEQQNIQLISQTSFPNHPKGFKRLLQWSKEQLGTDGRPWYVMEATGVYYEALAYFLAAFTTEICVLLPNKSKYFAKSLDLKTKTDKVDAAMLCRIGLERQLRPWTLPSPALKRLKSLCREYRVLKENGTRIKGRLHALAHSHEPEKHLIQRLKQQLNLISKQLKEVEAEIREQIQEDAYLKKQFANIEQIKGLGTLTIATVVAETNGFACFENAKQLTSYAGLDVMMRQSGLYSGSTHISKKGNRHIRATLYLPALAAIRYNEHLKQCYQTIMESHQSGKVGVVAIARKMLILIYTLWKKETPYDPLLNVV